VSLAFKYIAVQRPDFAIQPELRLSYADSKVNAFNETNGNALQALNVHSQSVQSFTTEAAISGNWQVNAQFSLNGRLGVSHNNADASHGVSANVLSEAESFSVSSPGMGNSAVSLGMGAKYNVNDKWTVSAAYRKSTATNAQDSNAFSLNATMSF